MKLLLISARNLFRNRLRTALTVLAAAIAILAFVMLRTVLTAWEGAADYAAKDRLGTRHKVSFVISLPKRYIDSVREVPGIKQATYMTWFGGKNPSNPDDFFATFAVDVPSFLDVYDEMVLSPQEKSTWIEDRRGAVVGEVLAKRLNVKVGDKLKLTGSIYPGDWEFNVVGVYKASRKSIDLSSVFFHWNNVNESLPEGRRDQIGWIAARVDDPGRGATISQVVDKLFEDKDIQTVTMSERAMNLSFMGMMSAILKALNIVSIIIMVIMMMILGNTIAMGVRERTREYAVLRALGFMPWHIRLFIVGEAVFVGALAGVLGLMISFPIVEKGMGTWLEQNMGSWFPYFRIAPSTMVVAMLLSIVLGSLASLIPAIQAGKLSVTEALRRVA